MSPAVDTVRMPDLTEGVRCRDTDHRSYSSDKRWDQCAWMGHAYRDLGIADAMGPEACVGSAVDAALVGLIEGGSPDIGRLLDAAIADLGDPVKRGMWDRTEMLSKATRLVALAGDRVLPTYEAHGGVYATQLELHADVDGVPYHVHIDAILGDGTIVDWKTSEKRLPDRAAASSPQLTGYFHAVRAEYGHLAPAVWLDALIYANPPEDIRSADPTATKPWHQRDIGTRTEQQVEAWVDDFRRREAARSWMTKTGIYPTPGRTQMEFICRGCPARSLCPSWAGTL